MSRPAGSGEPMLPDSSSGSPISSPPPATPSMNAAGDNDDGDSTASSVPTQLAWRLYTSHFLSTWNSRLFEFGAVLFLASIFPDTLMPMSVYALVRSGAAILFAQSVGTWIDNGDRLTVVRVSIVAQRIAVAVSCGLFWAMEQRGPDMDSSVKSGLFGLTIIAACVEKLAAMMNLVSVERDWVVVITEGKEQARRELNARMRRIDLICKLLGPFAISTIAIASTLVAIWATLGMNLAAIVVEYRCIAQVYKMAPGLRRETQIQQALSDNPEANDTVCEAGQQQANRPNRVAAQLRKATQNVLPVSALSFYFRHPAFLPSFALSLLYLTVLSFSGQLITYLLSVGYTSLHVGLARTISTIFELSATWAAPRLMKRVGIVRGGIWSLSWQMIWLAAGVSWFLADFHVMGTNSVTSATGLVVGVALSRVGLWGYDLCAQNIIQDEVATDSRGTFSTVEASFQNMFELVSYATTIVFSRPDQFQWPVLVSVVAVYAAGGLYALFVRQRRGHLFHAPPCVCLEKEDRV